MMHFRTLEHISPLHVIAVATLAAACMMSGHWASLIIGGLASVMLAALAFRAPWLGLLAIFPLASAIHPTPAGIGVQEAGMGLLVAVVTLKSIVDSWLASGWPALLYRYGRPLAFAGALAIVNLAVALFHGVALADWLRGLVPFLFLALFVPVALAIEHHPERLSDLAISICAMISLMALHVVVYYLANGLHHPYWLIEKDGGLQRIPETLLALHADARGPMLDRVTTFVQSATDASLPVGVVVGLVIAAWSRDRMMATMGYAVSVLSLVSVLMTYTRSMLISVGGGLLFFVAESLLSRRFVARVVGLIIGLVLAGVIAIQSLGIGAIWGYRMAGGGEVVAALEEPTSDAATSKGAGAGTGSIEGKSASVTTRLEEYRIAWGRFVDHPLLGNGVGDKHAIRFEGPGGWVEQKVGYIHNWPLYFLMTTGIVGFLAYARVILTPIIVSSSKLLEETPVMATVRYGILTMAIYGLFFAVFRLITFNLLLSAAWGVVLAYSYKRSPASE